MSKYCFKIDATDENNLKKIENTIEHFKNQIILMSLTRTQTDHIFNLTQSVIDVYSDAVKSVVPQREEKIHQSLKEFHDQFKATLDSHSSAFKRKKQIEKNIFYVPPEEKAIGFKWTQTFDEATGNIVRKYQQNTFQFIRPSAIIRALFSNPDFVKMYEEQLNNKDHVCKEGVYRDYCCGSHFKQNEFFINNPSALKIQIYTDDFEPCDALKSKAGKHKKCAFYMIIRNMPKKLQSKLSNIFLIAVADSIDLKTESASFENIIEVIKDDLNLLESIGIKLHSDKIVKGCLICMCFDNLGANICYGLPKVFRHIISADFVFVVKVNVKC